MAWVIDISVGLTLSSFFLSFVRPRQTLGAVVDTSIHYFPTASRVTSRWHRLALPRTRDKSTKSLLGERFLSAQCAPESVFDKFKRCHSESWAPNNSMDIMLFDPLSSLVSTVIWRSLRHRKGRLASLGIVEASGELRGSIALYYLCSCSLLDGMSAGFVFPLICFHLVLNWLLISNALSFLGLGVSGLMVCVLISESVLIVMPPDRRKMSYHLVNASVTANTSWSSVL